MSKRITFDETGENDKFLPVWRLTNFGWAELANIKPDHGYRKAVNVGSAGCTHLYFDITRNNKTRCKRRQMVGGKR